MDTMSDGAEKLLAQMVGQFSVRRAVDWLRVKFPSFDTARAEPLDCASTKNEKDYFDEARLLGFVTKLDDGEVNRPLVVAAVRMRRELTERTSRLVQFNYAKKVLQGAIAKGALGFSGIPSQGLFFFHDRNGFFRLSLVTAEVERRKLKWNEAKRQSFYIEPGAANNIVRRRLADPIRSFADLRNAFSVEQLTKEFYRKLFEWYTWAMEPSTNVHFPNDLSDDRDDRRYNNEAVIRLITRLMFTWFIRQRKLVPDELFDRDGVAGLLRKFDPDSMEQDNYYRAILQNLFFATFNCQPEKRRFIHTFQGRSAERHITTLYRYEKEFRGGDGSAFRATMRKVPFLNCALFDCLDRREREEDGGRELYFDGFSGEKGHAAHLPNGLFFDDERGIVSLFNRYEFTVNENDADDSDVALDPELLGKVFENLLGAFNPETQETARKATGSFYTPREIVDYMVEESLKGYLESRCGVDDARLADLFDRNKAAEGAPTPFSRKEEEALLDALYGCRILDPACGSGAFPMGVLHCMVRLLTRLDPQNLSIRERLLKRYREDKARLAGEESPAELEARLREGQHYPDYERKLFLIENCIYGVDIQPIATQISKLRFFISLLCDQLRTSYDPSAENYGLLSLPNLEAKFVCANTLVSLPEVGALDASVGDIATLRHDLQENRHKIFSARSTATKEKYKARDLEIRDAIRKEVRDSLSKPDETVIAELRQRIAEARKRREKVAEPDWEEVLEPAQMNLFGETLSQPTLIRRDRNATKREALDREIDWAERGIAREEAKGDRSNVGAATRYADMVAGWDPYDQNKSEGWFDPEWMFNVKDGFDVVIGNPPYVSNMDDKVKQYLRANYETSSYLLDLYIAFIEVSKRFLSVDGLLCLITPNSWMKNHVQVPIRKFVLEKLSLKKIVPKITNAFDSANIETSIMIANNESGVCQIDVIEYEDNKFTYLHSLSTEQFLENDGLVFDVYTNETTRTILKKIRRNTNLVEDLFDTIRGIGPYKVGSAGQTPAIVNSRAFHATYAKDKTFVPELRGKHVKTFTYHWDGKDYISYGKWLSEPRDPSVFEGNRLVFREILGERLVCTFISETFKMDRSLYIAKPKDGSSATCKFVLGVLASKAMIFYFKNSSNEFDELFPKIRVAEFRKLPIPKADTAITNSVIKVVDCILAAKKADPAADTSALESEIDALVYKLYGLTEDEIAVVEGRNNPAPQPSAAQSPAPAARKGPRATAKAEEAEDEVLE